MTDSYEWHDLGDEHGVLELEPTAPGLGLELQVLSGGYGTMAWWVLEGGQTLRQVSVGEA